MPDQGAPGRRQIDRTNKAQKGSQPRGAVVDGIGRGLSQQAQSQASDRGAASPGAGAIMREAVRRSTS
jgi:hypothetical protein